MRSTGFKLCGAGGAGQGSARLAAWNAGGGEWLVEKHGAKTRRFWRKLHIGVDADAGQIIAAALTTRDVDDGAAVDPLLDQVPGPVASFTADGAYDREGVFAAVCAARGIPAEGALAHGQASGDRGGRCCPCPQPGTVNLAAERLARRG